MYRWIAEGRTPYPRHRTELAELVGRTEAELWPPKPPPPPDASASDWTHVPPPDLTGIEAIELVRRVEASDAGAGTIEATGRGVDQMARAYTHTAPAELLVGLTAYQGYVARLLDGRATLGQRRRLMSHAGWLSLLTATADLDRTLLGRYPGSPDASGYHERFVETVRQIDSGDRSAIEPGDPA